MPDGTLRGTVVTGYLWSGSARIAQQAIAWAINILIARILVPSDYGLMALGNLFIYFSSYFYELSFGAALIQRADIDNEYEDSAFWFMVSVSVAIALCIGMAAPTIARYFGEPRLDKIIMALGSAIVINSIAAVPLNLLSRGLRFRHLAFVNFTSDLAMGATSLACAYAGLGVWSLVFGAIARSAVMMSLAFLVSSWRPGLRFSKMKTRELLSFGLPLTGSKVVSSVVTNADTFIIGKMLGSIPLGYYYMATRLSAMPFIRLLMVVNDVNFPALSRVQDEHDKVRKHFLSLARYVSLVVLPAMIGMFIVAEDFIVVLLGQKWLPAVTPLRVLCLVSIFRTNNFTIPPILISRGKPKVVMKYNLICAIILPPALLIGAQFGFRGILYALLIVYPLFSAYLLRIILNEINLKYGDYLETIKPALIATAFLAPVVLMFQYVFHDGSRLFRLIGSIVSGMVIYPLSIYVIKRDIFINVANLFQMRKTKDLKA